MRNNKSTKAGTKPHPPPSNGTKIHKPKFEDLKPVPDNTVMEIMRLRANHEPEDQNIIVDKVIEAIAIDREKTYRKAREVMERASKNAEQFMNGKEVAHKALKEMKVN